MPEDKFPRMDDVRMKLHSVLCKYQGDIGYIRAEGESFECSFVSLTEGIHEKMIDANDPDLELGNLPLGYVNERTGKISVCRPVFLKRSPARVFKCGACQGNTIGSYFGRREPANILYTSEYVNTVKNIYPRFDSLVEGAFSREFAVSKSRNIWCQDILIGRVVDGSLNLTKHLPTTVQKELFDLTRTPITFGKGKEDADKDTLPDYFV